MVEEFYSQEVYFNDGEDLVLEDLNGMQAKLRSFVQDLMLGAQAHTAEATQAGEGVVYCSGNGCQPFLDGLVVRFRGGTLLQMITSALSSLDPQLVAFSVADIEGNALDTTLAADPSNDKIHVICIKLSQTTDEDTDRDFKDETTGALSTVSVHKRRRVKLEKSTVSGNLSSGEPAIPSGYVRLATAIVRASASSVASDELFDHRYPLGTIKSYVVPASAARISSGWGTLADGRRTSTAASQVLRFDCPSQTGRLLAVDCSGLGPAVAIQREDWNNSGETSADVKDITGGAHAALSLTTLNTFGPEGPIWCRGYGMDQAQQAAGVLSLLRTNVHVRCTSSDTGQVMAAVRFIVLE